MDKLTQGWVQHLRNSARQETPSRNYECVLCEAEVQPNIDAFKEHVRADTAKHPSLVGDADIDEAFRRCTLRGNPPSKNQGLPTKSAREGRLAPAATRKRPVSGSPDVDERANDASDRLNMASDGTQRSQKGSKRLCSPPASTTQQRGSSPPTPGRSRARPSESANDFDRGSNQRQSNRQLWVPEDSRVGSVPQRPKTPQTKHNMQTAAATAPVPAASSNRRRSPPRGTRRRHSHHRTLSLTISDAASPSEMIRQPDTRPISSDQLVAEVKGIYAGLVLLEGKCIEYDSTQKSADLSEEQYHALISLHRSLLHEHHDFFLASQHPSASDALRRLAAKFSMPARMWRHGIHSFLELLRHKLPASLEHMQTYIYIAYSMMALLYETVPAFEDTWIECLGDLGRYRMAIEDDDIRDREIWTGVSRYWYARASDKAPTTGRLYHHLAILARPNALQQLFYYAKALCVPIPFLSARDSVMTLFDPLLAKKPASTQRLEQVDASFVRVFGILFSGKSMDQLEFSKQQFLDNLDGRIGWEHGNWLESGYHVGISLSCLLLGFCDGSNVLLRAVSGSKAEADVSVTGPDDVTTEDQSSFETAVTFASQAYDIVIQRTGDKNILPFIHTTLVFHMFMMQHPAAMEHLEGRFQWKDTCVLLNYLLRTCEITPRMESEEFPGPERNEAPHPLPEDYAMRGLIYAEDYFPQEWFENNQINDDEKYFEPASTVGKRYERILWIGHKIASHKKWLTWDTETRQFSVTAKYDKQYDNVSVMLPQPDTTSKVGETDLSERIR